MQHARKVRWQTPITDAPHLWGRSHLGDPRSLRARRPLFMMMRVFRPGHTSIRDRSASGSDWLECGPGRDLAYEILS